MSKVFEALQRLERESGKPPTGVSAEAQQVLRNGAAVPDATSAFEQGSSKIAEPTEAPTSAPIPSKSNEVESAFGLEQIPIENAVVTPGSRIVYYTDPDGPGADRFRLLRMRLWPLWESGKLKALLVTSAQGQDGKSTIALNLATALAERGQRNVLLIEGDLHHPSLTHRLGLPNRAGLA
jgi:Mrp family chromosome partitioning ATPase